MSKLTSLLRMMSFFTGKDINRTFYNLHMKGYLDCFEHYTGSIEKNSLIPVITIKLKYIQKHKNVK